MDTDTAIFKPSIRIWQDRKFIKNTHFLTQFSRLLKEIFITSKAI